MTLKTLARSYACTFGFIHLAAMFLGLQVGGVPSIVSDGLLTLFAFLCFLGVWVENKNLRFVLTFGWSVSVMVEWMHLIAWVPAMSDAQYLVFALLNMGMALSLGILAFEE
jgi:hypothetical protein